MNELTFTEDRNLRDNCISHYEVLGRVKNLLLIPYADVATAQQVADFYDVDIKTIHRVYELNSEELKLDGVGTRGYKNFLIPQVVDLETLKRKSIANFRKW